MILYLVCRETDNPELVQYIHWFASKTAAIRFVQMAAKDGETFFVNRYNVRINKEEIAGILNGLINYHSADRVLTFRMRDGRLSKSIHPLS